VDAWQTIAVVIGCVLALCGPISTIGGAVEKVAKVVKAAKAPNDEQDRRLGIVEKEIVDIKSFLANDKKRIDSLEEGNRVTQRALIALLGHGLDGNNQKQMEDAKKALESYLINR
jgi:hypothetical protein